ncbi:MAG: family 43 glycosylhydrolase [Bacilli bacterium]|nr:family 43 glycosylhydrolase [Bacilli bacterium]
MKKGKSLLILTLLSLSSCGSQSVNPYGYYDQLEKDYDTDVFFRNDTKVYGADPGSLYISDVNDPNYGYFYIYPTTDLEMGCLGFAAYRTKNFIDYETVGPAFEPTETSFSQTSFWAPEVIFDGEADQSQYGLGSSKGVYYMFYSADDKYNKMVGSYYPQFLTHADKNEYNSIRSSIYLLTFSQCEAIINDFRVEVLPEKYQPFRKTIEKYIKAYDNAIITLETEAQKTELARDYATRLRSSYIHIENVINDFNVGVAVSASPNGPFIQYTNTEESATRRALSEPDPFISAEDLFEYGNAKENVLFDGEEGFATIDCNPFVDPVTGDKYLYFVRRHSYSGDTNFVVGMKMGASWTDDPEWNTLKRLTTVNKKTVNGDEGVDYEPSDNTINEGPEMIYEDGTYFLTFSVDNCNTPKYTVGTALSSSPLGDFTKLERSEGGLVLSISDKRSSSGCGHHSFVRAGGELIIIYHGHWIVSQGKGQRKIMADRCFFTKNNDNKPVIYCNGPTSTVQPQIGPNATYTNIANEAKIIASDIAEDVSYLVDGMVPVYSYNSFVKEFNPGKEKITLDLKFNTYKKVKSVLVYDSINLSTAFDKVDTIRLHSMKDGQPIVYTLSDVKVNPNDIDEKNGFVNQCAAAIAEFEELNVNEIEVVVSKKGGVAVGEIAVLGE